MGSYTAAAVDMLDFWERHGEWSEETFGPSSHRGPIGPLRHLEKEAVEAYLEEDNSKQKEEIADCLFLVFDAARRAGMSYSQLTKACMAKLRKNKERTWPDWRNLPADMAIEHHRVEG